MGANDEVPSSRVLCYAMGGRYLQTGEKLFSDVWVRTSDVVSDGHRVLVGFRPGGVSVDHWYGRPRAYIGLASAWKSD